MHSKILIVRYIVFTDKWMVTFFSLIYLVSWKVPKIMKIPTKNSFTSICSKVTGLCWHQVYAQKRTKAQNENFQHLIVFYIQKVKNTAKTTDSMHCVCDPSELILRTMVKVNQFLQKRKHRALWVISLWVACRVASTAITAFTNESPHGTSKIRNMLNLSCQAVRVNLC